MAKIVSTKFGDRRLVYLPPINLKRNKTPNVETIETNRQVPDRHTDAVSVVPKEYAYHKQPAGKGNAWLGAPAALEGNIVTEYPKAVGDQIFQQLYQQAGTDSMANYNQGQYPVLPPIGESAPQMQYTNYGRQNMPQQQTQAPQSGPAQQPTQHSPPQEKHIYYGPNGEVLPGPPNCHNNRREIPQDFAFEGMLHFGRLRTVNLIENMSGFPKLPDYLIKDLQEKYGQYEQTSVRVVSRLGRCYVHATPLIRQNPQMPVKPEYFPVYLNEDEEFDYDKFMSDYGYGQNRAPYHPTDFYDRKRQWAPPNPRKFVRRVDALRPHTYDNAENFRWRKNDDRFGRNSSRQSEPSRAEISEYRPLRGRRKVETRDDIRPIERLDSRLR